MGRKKYNENYIFAKSVSNGPTDGQSLLMRCEDASKKRSIRCINNCYKFSSTFGVTNARFKMFASHVVAGHRPDINPRKIQKIIKVS